MDISKLTTTVGQYVIKHAPELLMGAGIVGTVSAAGLAGAATLKAKKHIDNFVDVRTEKAFDTYETEEAEAMDIMKDAAKTAGKVALAYAPAVAAEVAGVCCLLAANKIQENRISRLTEDLAAVTASFTAVAAAFDKYRRNVKAKYGEEEDKLMRYGEIVEETDKKGNVVQKVVMPGDKEFEELVGDFPTSFLWDEITANRKFCYKDQMMSDPDLVMNYSFLKAKEQELDLYFQLLPAGSVVTLNRALNLVGLPETKQGAVLGWIKTYDQHHISFGLDSFLNLGARNMEEPCWVLDFNVDGVIFDKMVGDVFCNI